MVGVRGRQGGHHAGLIGLSHRLWLWERETHSLSKGLVLALVMVLVGVVGFALLSMVYYAPGSANLAPDSH